MVCILEAVIRLNHQLSARAAIRPNPAMYNEALQCALRQATHDYLIASISDGFGVDHETFRLGTRIADHTDVIVLFIYDAKEG